MLVNILARVHKRKKRTAMHAAKLMHVSIRKFQNFGLICQIPNQPFGLTSNVYILGQIRFNSWCA